MSNIIFSVCNFYKGWRKVWEQLNTVVMERLRKPQTSQIRMKVNNYFHGDLSPLVGDDGLHLVKGKSSMQEQVVELVITSLFH